MDTENVRNQGKTEGQQRERLYANARTELLDRQFSNSQAYDKAVLTLSSAFLALSLTFKRISRPRVPQGVFGLSTRHGSHWVWP